MNDRKKKIRRFAPCSAMDIERLESWLTDMAAQGWHLTEAATRLSIFTFAQGEPKNVRYRLEPGKQWDDGAKPAHSVQEFFKDSGWEAVTSFGRFFIFRDLSPDAPELNTDLLLHAETMKQLRRKTVIRNVVLLCFMAVWMPLLLLRDGYKYLVLYGAGFAVFFGCLLLICIVEIILNIVHTNACVRRLSSGVPLDHNKPWRKGAAYFRIVSMMNAVCFVLWIALILTRCASAVVQFERPLSDYQGDPPIVTIGDLCTEEKYTRDSRSNYNRFAAFSSSCGESLEWYEYGRVQSAEGEITEALLDVCYHDTAAEWIARGLAEEYLREAQRNRLYSELPAPELEADFVVCYSYGGSPIILIQQGDIVIRAWMNIDIDGEDATFLWAEMMMEMLEE